MAMVYDLILLFGIVFVAFLPIPAIPESFMNSTTGKLFSQAWLIFVIFGFFGWFWTHGGQTLGMRAWRIKVITSDDGELNWWQAAKRFIAASISLGAFGIGLFWCIFQSDNMTLHDLYSGTRLVMIEKRTAK